MRLLRKIIFIGESSGYTVYIDTESNIPLKAEKSKIINTEKSKSQFKYIIPLMLVFLILRKIGYEYFTNNNFLINYTYGNLIILFIVCFLECLGLTILIDRALYKNVKSAKPATEDEFYEAISSNNIWNMFADKKVTFQKKIISWALTMLFVFLNFASVILLFDAIAIGDQLEIIKYGLFGGFLAFITILFIWKNNMIRWLNVVEKYQKGTLWKI